MDFNDYLSEQIYRGRKRAGYTQAHLSQKLGVSVRWYQRIEKGERLPGAVVLIKLMLLLDIDIEVFRDYFMHK
ncbi:MAG: helix-turn-helix transcriptional regulator [Ruminococcaceae bacterium]|nr:helix-turn-helix transcriptional regulator [Oscillospiraceae bacterium]